jgi:hypothetical protein
MRGFADVLEAAAAAGRDARRGATVSPGREADAEVNTMETPKANTTEAKRTPREIILDRSLAMRRGRLEGNAELMKARTSPEEGFELKKRETNNVEEEVLKILRDVVQETRDERARSRGGGDERETVTTPVAVTNVATPAPRPTVSEDERTKTQSILWIAVVTISLLLGLLCGRMIAATSGVEDAVVRPRSVPPRVSFDLAGTDLDASLMAELDRARSIHDTSTDEVHRKRIRIAAKRARDARRVATERIAASVGGDADPAREYIQLAESTCRAVRAFSELHRATKDME